MEYLDCDVLLGQPRVPDPDRQADRADLLAEMDRLDVARALVRHRASQEVAPETGNRLLMQELDHDPRLVPAWFVKPEGAEPEFDPARMVRAMVGRGVRAAWTVPNLMGVPLEPWSYGRLLEALASHRVPLLLCAEDVPAADLDAVLTAFPRLRVVLLHVPRLGRNRMLYALMERHVNLHACVGPPFSAHLAVEDLYRRFGSSRLVFGTHYPVAEGGAAVCQLMYADIDDEAKHDIAHRTAERLIAEVAHEPIG